MSPQPRPPTIDAADPNRCPAQPITFLTSGPLGQPQQVILPGISIRRWMAATIAAGACAHPGTLDATSEAADIARLALSVADAIIELTPNHDPDEAEPEDAPRLVG